MPFSDSTSPYLGFNFLIEFENAVVGGFSEISGLQVEIEIEEIKEGGVNDHVHKVPKGAKYQNIVLKRGITDSDVLWRWHQDVIRGKFKRKNILIILLDLEGNEKWRWSISGAYPMKWIGPELKAEKAAVAFESIELVHNGFEKV
ncbi:MAG: phage tail protein [Methanothrix sp.]|nr:phage tail protein [Methanothrix sp.]